MAVASAIIQLAPTQTYTFNDITRNSHINKLKFTESYLHLAERNLPKLMENFYTQIVFSDAFTSHWKSDKSSACCVVCMCVCGRRNTRQHRARSPKYAFEVYVIGRCSNFIVPCNRLFDYFIFCYFWFTSVFE